MFSKEEEKALRSAFWGTLSDKIQKYRSASGRRINWFKYPTRISDIYVRAEADENGCRVCVDIQFPDAGIRELFYEQFLETKTVFEERLGGKVIWNPNYIHSYGTPVCRISVENRDTNFYNQDDWLKMHDFIITHLRGFDSYWTEFDELFTTLL
jgi:hypothetical protein